MVNCFKLILIFLVRYNRVLRFSQKCIYQGLRYQPQIQRYRTTSTVLRRKDKLLLHSMYYRLAKPCFISTQSCDRVVDLLSLVIKIKHLSGLHFPALPAAFPALIATGHPAFGYVLLLPFPLLNSVLSNGLKSDCIYARTITDMKDHKAAIKYSGKWRL